MKTVVIIGAGCSAGLGGLPADRQFIDQKLSPYLGLASGLSPNVGGVDDSELFFVMEAYRQFYEKDIASFGGKLCDVRLETFWNEIDENYNKSKIVLHSRIIDQILQRAQSLAQKENDKTYKYFWEYFNQDTQPRSPYEYFFMFAGWQLRKYVASVYSATASDAIRLQYGRLIKQLKKIVGGDEMVFISFNYDTFLEQSVSSYHYYGLDDLELRPNALNIIKPHGSVNWLHVVNKSISQQKHPIPISDIGYKNGELHQHAIVGLVANKIEYDKDKQDDACVKKLYVDRLLPLMTKELSEANCIVVIGYSFPLVDGHIRNALKNSSPKNLGRLLIIDKDQPDLNRDFNWERLNLLLGVGYGRTYQSEFWNHGVESWVDFHEPHIGMYSRNK